jgi:hypothetical protein
MIKLNMKNLKNYGKKQIVFQIQSIVAPFLFILPLMKIQLKQIHSMVATMKIYKKKNLVQSQMKSKFLLLEHLLFKIHLNFQGKKKKEPKYREYQTIKHPNDYSIQIKRQRMT